MKITVLDGFTLNPGDLSWDSLRELGDLDLYDRTEPDKTIERIGSAEIIFTNKTQITAEIIKNCPNLKFIGVLATGYNVVDTIAAKENGIVVCNVPTYGTAAVAQMVFALILELCHHVGHHNKRVQQGAWTESIDFCFWDYPLIELAGKTLGIIGLGKIGQATAKIAQGFGLNVIAYDKNAMNIDGIEMLSLNELYAKSDIISLHCPLFPDTEGIINAESIAKMKDGVIIINTSRGGLIVEADLKKALESGKVYGAASDVVSTEPIAADNVLLGLDNMIITPHIAWAPKEARQRLMNTAVDNLKNYLAGNPQNVVNK